MRRILYAVLILLLAATVEGATLTETVDRTIDVKPGASLVLTNVNGRVTVSSWDQPRVHVVARKEVEADRDEVKEVMRALRVDIQAKDGGVVIVTHHPKHSDAGSSIFDWLLNGHVSTQVRYDIMVPTSMNVDVTNTNGGIRLANVTGRHELGTTNGKIEVDGCAGSLDASTTNGSIQAELVRVEKGRPITLETTNGRIEVALPPDFAGNVDAGTTNGAIRSDLPVATTHLSKSSLRGTVNGGGVPVRLRTTNGGIEIRTAGKS